MDKKRYFVGKIDQPAGAKGWLVGSFLPEEHPCHSKAVEVGWKIMGPETREPLHIHKQSIEIWVVHAGSVRWSDGKEEHDLSAGDYMVVHPYAPTSIISAAPGTAVSVVKAPSIPTDKFPYP